MENLLPGQKYGKCIPAICGHGADPSGGEPFTSGSNLDEVLARSYEDLVIRGEAGELKEQLGATSQQKRLGQILSQYEEAVGRDVRELAQTCGLTVMGCPCPALRVMKTARSLEQCGKLRQFFRRSPHRQKRGSCQTGFRNIMVWRSSMWKLKLPEGKDRWIFLLTVGRDSLYSGISGGQ